MQKFLQQQNPKKWDGRAKKNKQSTGKKQENSGKNYYFREEAVFFNEPFGRGFQFGIFHFF